MVALIPKKLDTRVEVYFAEPIFDLIKQIGPSLHEEMWKHLSPYGLTIRDVQTDQLQSQVLTSSVTYVLVQYSAAIRVMLDHCEIAFLDLQKLRMEDVNSITAAAINGIWDSAGGPQDLVNAKVASAIHAETDGESREVYLTGLTTDVPDGFGPLVGTGKVYYFGQSEEFTNSSILVEPSADYENSIFIRVTADFSIDNDKIANLFSSAANITDRAITALGLEMVNLGGPTDDAKD